MAQGVNVARTADVYTQLKGFDNELADERLNQRSCQILEALAANPEASINAFCAGWSESIAAYRFFNIASVTPEQIFSGCGGG